MSELKAYKMIDKDYCDDSFCVVPSDVYLKSEADEVICHQKYKRCLAMAKWCASRSVMLSHYGNEKDSDWFWKWKDKWKKLAEQFKEAK